MYLLDTNVISETRRPRPDRGVLNWLTGVPDEELHVSAVTIGELQAGIEITREQDSAKAEELEAWLGKILTSYTFDEIIHSVVRGEIVEDYPDDGPYPSCLIYGDTPTGEPVHSVWAYNRETESAVLITTYRPDPSRWVMWRTRRSE